MQAGTNALYDERHKVFSAPYGPTQLHAFLAKLPATLRAKKYPRPCMLIVTTNCDDLMEQAFASAGEPFDRVTYIAEGRYRGKTSRVVETPNSYHEVSTDNRSVLLKIHGEVDRRGPTATASSSPKITTSITWPGPI